MMTKGDHQQFDQHYAFWEINWIRGRRIYNLQILMQEWQQILIDVVGWIYFAAWSLSFYGQIYINYKVKSVQGMNFDFVAMNLTGFIFYSIYNTEGYFVSSAETGHVDLNDVFFAYHALFATLICVSQIMIYPKGINRVHAPTILLLVSMWTFLMVYSTLVMQTKTLKVGSGLGVFNFIGYFKLAISNLKYLPQLYWNYKRKSTKGWSIFNILMDFSGGAGSFLQLALEAAFGQDVQLNFVKLSLSIVVMFYDILFIVQHYCIYRKPADNKPSIYTSIKEDI